MKEFKDKVAVITGSASGMGKGFAKLFGSEGCKIVLADIEEPALAQTLEELQSEGIEAIAVKTDVSKKDDIEALSEAALKEYGQVNLLFNNAGVAGGGTIAETDISDWEWVLGVNLWGVIYGLKTFLPHMLEHGDGHIVNTASIAGLTSYTRMGPYNTSKHGVVTISETLYKELAEMNSSLGVSVLCPSIINTNIISSHRNRPERLQSPIISEDPDPEENINWDLLQGIYGEALTPDIVAEQVKAAIENMDFYIWTDLVYKEAIKIRCDDVSSRHNPTLRKHLLEEDQSKRF